MTQPSVGPTPWPQQPPPRRGTRTLVIVLAVIVVVIVATAGTCAVVVGNLLGGSRAYFDAANDYLAALKDGDPDAAYALLCPDVTATVSRDEFAAAVEGSERPTDRRMNSYFTSTTDGVTGHVV